MSKCKIDLGTLVRVLCSWYTAARARIRSCRAPLGRIALESRSAPTHYSFQNSGYRVHILFILGVSIRTHAAHVQGRAFLGNDRGIFWISKFSPLFRRCFAAMTWHWRKETRMFVPCLCESELWAGPT